MKHLKIVLLALGFLVSTGILNKIWADAEPGDFIKSRTYVGAFGTSSMVNAGSNAVLSFNGIYEVASASGPLEIDLLPTISRNFGYGLLAGHREGAYAVEISFWKSAHNSEWSGGTPTVFYGTALYQSFNLDFKRYVFTHLPVQPFFNLGLSFPWLIFQQGSADGFGRTGDASYAGFGANVGAGLEIYIGDSFSIVGSAIQRFVGYNSVSGIYQEHNLDIEWNGSKNLNIEGDGMNFMVGATFGFEE